METDLHFHYLLSRTKQVAWFLQFLLVGILILFWQRGMSDNIFANAVFYIHLGFFAVSLSLLMIERNKHKLGAEILIYSMTVMTFSLVWVSAGLLDLALFGVPALLIFASMLGLNRAFIMILTITVVNLLLLSAVVELEIVKFAVPLNGLIRGVLVLAVLMVTAFSMRLLGEDHRRAMEQLNQQIDEINHAHSKLESLNNNLEIQVEQRTNELQKTMGKLAEESKLATISRMVIGMSHELNTPLGTAVTACSINREKVAEIKNQLQSENLTAESLESLCLDIAESAQLVERNLERMTVLMGKFKELESSEDDVGESINLSLFFEVLVEELADSIARLDIDVKLDVDENIELNVPPKRLHSCFRVLFNNVFEHAFTDQDSKQITIQAEQDNKQVRISFADNGIGISDELLAKVFDPFVAKSMGDRGTGLGLNILYNQVVLKLGGEVQCFNRTEGGVEVVIALGVG